MRCKEVRQWMNAGEGTPSPAIVRHIADCPSCAREVHADSSLKELFSALRPDEQVASPAVFRERAEAAAAEQSVMEKIMLSIKDQASLRPRLLAGAALAVAAFLFVTLVPFSFTHTAGYVVSVEDTVENEQVTVEDVEKAIEAAEVSDVAVVVTRAGDINTYTISELPNLKIANRVALAIRKSVDRAIELHVEPNIKVMSGPIYAQVVRQVVKEKEKPRRIKLELGKMVIGEKVIFEAIDDFELKDVEVEKIIKERLIEQGAPADAIKVTSETDADSNTRTIKLEVDSTVVGESESEMAFFIVDETDNHRHREYAVKTRTSDAVRIDSLGNKIIRGHTIIIKLSLKGGDE